MLMSITAARSLSSQRRITQSPTFRRAVCKATTKNRNTLFNLTGLCRDNILRRWHPAMSVATTFLSGGGSRGVSILFSFFYVKDIQLDLREDHVEFFIADAEVKEKEPSLLKELGRVGLVATGE